MDFAQFVIDIILFLVYSFAVILILAYVWRFWKLYVIQKHINGLDWVMLEILLPREIFKSPVAFELVATALLQAGGVNTWQKRNWLGSLPAWFSLEIASLEGTVHFYIRSQKKFRPLLESNIYAQYPGVEVIEVEDYTKLFRYDHLSDKMSTWGLSYVLSETFAVQKEDKEKGVKKETMPADFYAIRTYVDNGLDKDPKEEFKNDPLSQTIEFLGSLGKNQYAGIQLLVQDASRFDGKFFPAMYIHPVTHDHLDLKGVAELRKNQIKKRVHKKGELVFDAYGYPDMKMEDTGEKDENNKPIKKEVQRVYQEDKEETIKAIEISQEDKDEIEAINTKLSKPVARCVMRSIYVTKKEAFNPSHIQNLLSLPKPFSYPGYNSFRPKNLAAPYDFPWQNTMKKREPWRAEEVFDAYVEREGFHPHTGALDLGSWGDIFFFPYKGYVRRTAHMILESLLKPFSHPKADEVFSLNIEEIATLFHFPGRTAATPTLPRIDSAKGVAPTNLPQ